MSRRDAGGIRQRPRRVPSLGPRLILKLELVPVLHSRRPEPLYRLPHPVPSQSPEVILSGRMAPRPPDCLREGRTAEGRGEGAGCGGDLRFFDRTASESSNSGNLLGAQEENGRGLSMSIDGCLCLGTTVVSAYSDAQQRTFLRVAAVGTT